MAFTAQILNVRIERDKHRVTYQFVDGSLVRGPFITDRPVAELAEHQAWCDSIIPVDVDERQRLIAALAGNGDPAALENALISEGVDYCFFDGALIRVQGTPSNPSTLLSRLTARLGATAMNRIRTKLQNAGYHQITSAAIDRFNI